MFFASCKPLTGSAESGSVIQCYGSPASYQKVADALERLTANAKSTAVLGSTPASYDT